MIILYLLCCILFFSCDTNYITIPASEPEIIHSEGDSISSHFIAEVVHITDHDIEIKWSTLSGRHDYDIILNDTLLVLNDLRKFISDSYTYAKITNLTPETEYKITIRAINSDLNVKTTSLTAKTEKVFLIDYKFIPIDPYIYRLNYLVQGLTTHDNGHLLVGYGSVTYDDHFFYFIKLNEQNELLWINPIKIHRMDVIISTQELEDGNLLLTTTYGVTKIDGDNGRVIWSKDIVNLGDSERLYLESAVLLPDGGAILFGTHLIYGQSARHCFFRISKDGDLIWETYGKERDIGSRAMSFKTILSHDKNKIFAAGSSGENPSSQHDNIILIECGLDGTIIEERGYHTNQLGYQIVTVENIFYIDDSFYIFSIKKWNYESDLVIVKLSNDKVLQQCYTVDSLYVTSTTHLSYGDDGSFFCMTHSYANNIAIAHIDKEGHILDSTQWKEPIGIYLVEHDEELMTYYTREGAIYTINRKGYIY
ncbi:fibronectin type III domain-containing protein [Parabacteroides sp. OttesenSCG-928-J18]|nr:fibronectin type III domain-containing protein [Parabacteroides sp. OttesenSCG-928-J18]